MLQETEKKAEELFGPPVKLGGTANYYKCPNCGDSHHLWVGLRVGAYRCWICGFSGNLQSGQTGKKAGALPIKEKRTASSYAELYTTLFERMTLLPAHKLQLERRGVDAAAWGIVSAKNVLYNLSDFRQKTLIEAGIAYRNEEGKLCPRSCIQSGRILIPYRRKGKVVYFRGYDREDKNKYTSPAEVDCDSLFGRVFPGSTSVIVTEGEFKAALAVQNGYSALAIPGIWNLHYFLVNSLMKTEIKTIVIVFDTERKESKSYRAVETAAENLSGLLKSKGFVVKRLYLPIGINDEKMDLDAFILRHGADALAQLLFE